MIPVFQTRYAAATFGNCFEACIASILELPLSAVPDRSVLVDQDAWADLVSRTHLEGGDQAVGDLDLPAEYEDGEEALRTWLGDRGLAWLDLYIGTKRDEVPEPRWLEVSKGILFGGYWIAHTRTSKDATAHATVWRGTAVAHNPHRGWPDGKELGPLHAATLLVAGDPALLARTLAPLPDVAGEVRRLDAVAAGCSGFPHDSAWPCVG